MNLPKNESVNPPVKENRFLTSSITRVVLAVTAAALIVGLLATATKSRRAPRPAEVKPPDPAQIAYAEAEQIVRKNLPSLSALKFSDPATDDKAGAAEIGRGIWEAWGKVDGPTETGTTASLDWHIAWDRKRNQILYRKIGDKESGNYADALRRSGAYPVSSEPMD